VVYGGAVDLSQDGPQGGIAECNMIAYRFARLR
jgi:hypothetical protein